MFRVPATRLAARTGAVRAPQQLSLIQARASSGVIHAPHTPPTGPLSNPTLKNIEKRWEGMPLQEQAELWMSLRDRMKVDWHTLTLQEKKAAYWIAFGPHGPRAEPPPGEGWRIAGGVAIGLVVSLVIFSTIRMFAGPAPYTMTKEYQEASNELLIAQKADPFTGISSEGYKGPGMVQSPPKKAD